MEINENPFSISADEGKLKKALQKALAKLEGAEIVTPDPDEIVKTDKAKSLIPNSKLTPIYETDFFGGPNAPAIDELRVTASYYMDLGVLFNGCIGFPITGDSMSPLIKSGTIVFAKRVPEWKRHLEYAMIYGIVMKDGRKYLKYIKKSEEMGCLLLVSHDPFYDPFDVYKEDIRSIWLIEGWLTKRATKEEKIYAL